MLIDFLTKQTTHFRSNDIQKAEGYFFPNTRQPQRPTFNLIRDDTAPPPWAVFRNCRTVEGELQEFLFEDFEGGALKQAFLAVIIAIGWGSHPIKPSNYWEVPGSRWVDGIQLGSCATAGTIVSLEPSASQELD